MPLQLVVFSPSLYNDFAMLASVTASKAEVASSNNKIGAGFRNARANAIRCFCPPIIGFHSDQQAVVYVLIIVYLVLPS